MARVNATQWLDKWGRRLNAAGPDITAGVQRVKTAPGQLAAQAADRMLAGIQAAITSGHWANRVAGVSLQEWQDHMINKAIPRMAQGVSTAQKSKVQIITQTLQAVDAAAEAARAIPKGGIEQSIQRAATFMREMSARAPKKAGS